jgi:multidrug efflux pump subunit AcrB
MIADRRTVAYGHGMLTMCVVLHALYESLIAIPTLSALPFAGNAALLNQMMVVNDLDVIAIIGFVFSKRHRQEERNRDDRFSRRCRPRER